MLFGNAVYLQGRKMCWFVGFGLANATWKRRATQRAIEGRYGHRSGFLQRILDSEVGSEMGTDQWGLERQM